MGAFDIAPNILIPDPERPDEAEAFRKKWRWEAHEQIMIKGAYTSAEQEPVDNASSAIGENGKDAEIRLGSARTKLLEVMIVDWTLAVNGRKVAVNAQAIRKLPANYRKPVLDKCDEIAKGLTEDEQATFLPSANGHSQGNSTEMSQSLTLL